MFTVSVRLQNGYAETHVSQESWKKMPKFKQDEIINDLISQAKEKLKASIIVRDEDATSK